MKQTPLKVTMTDIDTVVVTSADRPINLIDEPVEGPFTVTPDNVLSTVKRMQAHEDVTIQIDPSVPAEVAKQIQQEVFCLTTYEVSTAI